MQGILKVESKCLKINYKMYLLLQELQGSVHEAKHYNLTKQLQHIRGEKIVTCKNQ